MWRVRSNERRAGSPEERDLVRECEAFLLGGNARSLDHTGQVIPAWAWLNALAHGSAEEIATLASAASALSARSVPRLRGSKHGRTSRQRSNASSRRVDTPWPRSSSRAWCPSNSSWRPGGHGR
jgi:hypothetical protein